jgi:hypothetical protein
LAGVAGLLVATLSFSPSPVHAADAPKAKPKAAAKPAAKKPATVVLPAATPEQLEAAKLVYYGHYECGEKQLVDIVESAKDAGYVEVKHGKETYLMKPVLSSTGALRLEDVKDRTLMVQIANKSMLLDVKAGHRIVDDCVSPKQRELIEEAARAKAAAGAASAPGQDVNSTGSSAPAAK